MTAKDTLKSIQHAINEFLGPKTLAEDGIFGPKSRAALEKVVQMAEKPETVLGSGEIRAEFDARTEKNLATLDPAAQVIFRPFIQAAKEAAGKLGFEYTAIGGTRSWAEQDKLYAQGRTAPGKIVTQARAGGSWHNFGIALDFGVFRDGEYLDDSEPKTASRVHNAIGKLAENFGIYWGGSWDGFPDEPHFQVAVPYT